MSLASLDFNYDVDDSYWSQSSAADLATPFLQWDEGRDDPMVASDDLSASRLSDRSMQSFASFFAFSRHQQDDLYRVHPASATVLFVDDPNDDALQHWKAIRLNSRRLQKYIHAGEGPSLGWRNWARAAHQEQLRRTWLDMRFERTVQQYTAILEEALLPLGFSLSAPYEDSLGGIVLDFTRLADRITYVFTKRDIQVLAYVAGKIAERIFENLPRSKVEILDVTEGLLAER